MTDLLRNVTKMSDYTQEYWQKQLNQFTLFYGGNQSTIMQLAENVYAGSIFPTPDPVKDNLSWFKVINQVSIVHINSML